MDFLFKWKHARRKNGRGCLILWVSDWHLHDQREIIQLVVLSFFILYNNHYSVNWTNNVHFIMIMGLLWTAPINLKQMTMFAIRLYHFMSIDIHSFDDGRLISSVISMVLLKDIPIRSMYNWMFIYYLQPQNEQNVCRLSTCCSKDYC